MGKTPNRRSAEKTVRTTVTMPADAYEAIEDVAKSMRVSVAWVVRHAVDQYLTGSSGKRSRRASNK